MKLDFLNKLLIHKASEKISLEGIPENYIFNNYWVELPNGQEIPFKHLIRIAYRIFMKNENVELDIQSNDGYRQFVKNLGYQINFYTQNISFFNKNEVIHFSHIASTPYRQSNTLNVQDGNRLKTLVRKVNKWAELSQIEDFYFNRDYHWQWSGTFKSYIWVRLTRPSGSQKI